MSSAKRIAQPTCGIQVGRSGTKTCTHRSACRSVSPAGPADTTAVSACHSRALSESPAPDTALCNSPRRRTVSGKRSAFLQVIRLCNSCTPQPYARRSSVTLMGAAEARRKAPSTRNTMARLVVSASAVAPAACNAHSRVAPFAAAADQSRVVVSRGPTARSTGNNARYSSCKWRPRSALSAWLFADSSPASFTGRPSHARYAPSPALPGPDQLMFAVTLP